MNQSPSRSCPSLESQAHAWEKVYEALQQAFGDEWWDGKNMNAADCAVAAIKELSARSETAPIPYVDRGDAVNLARNSIEDELLVITPKGIRILADAVLRMDEAIRLAPSATAATDDSLDGRRYRWLQRQECGNVCGKGGPDEDCYLQLNPRDMDMAIDAAMEASAPSHVEPIVRESWTEHSYTPSRYGVSAEEQEKNDRLSKMLEQVRNAPAPPYSTVDPCFDHNVVACEVCKPEDWLCGKKHSQDAARSSTLPNNAKEQADNGREDGASCRPPSVGRPPESPVSSAPSHERQTHHHIPPRPEGVSVDAWAAKHGFTRASSASSSTAATPRVDEWERSYIFTDDLGDKYATAYHDLMAFARKLETLAAPSATRRSIVEECAKAVEDYEWVDDASVQGPTDHQRACAAAVRRLIRRSPQGPE